MNQVNLQIYNKCNQHCVFCKTQDLINSGEWTTTSDKVLKKRIEKAAENGDAVLFSGGGEATTLENLPELIQYAKSLGVKRTVLETNAVRLADVNYIQALKQSGLDACIVSIHSQTADTSDKVTQAPGTFVKTIEGMKNILRYRFEFDSLLHTITSINYKQLPEFIEFIHNDFPNIKNITLSFIRPFRNDKKSCDLTPTYTDVKKYVHEAYRIAEKYSITLSTSPTLGIPFCFLQGIEHISGELRNHVLLGAENHRKLMSQYDKVKSDVCKSCSFDSYCAGIEGSYEILYGSEELQARSKDPKQCISKITDPNILQNAKEENEVKEIPKIKKHNIGRLEINRVCNQRCVFCSNPPKSGELDLTEISSRMDKLKEEDVTDIMITGGEPTLHKEFYKILHLAKEKRFEEITIQTNGSTLHTEERVKALLPYKTMIKANISFHASDRKLFGELSKAPGTYDNTLKTFENLGKYGIATNVTIVIQKANYKFLKSHLEFIRTNYPFVTHFSFNFIDPIYNAWDNKWTVPTFTESEPYIHEAFSYILDQNCTFRIEKMPLCYLNGFEQYQSNLRRHLFDEKRVCSFLRIEQDNVDQPFVKPEFKVEEGKSEFYYSEQCKKCSLNEICPGINSNYVRIYGAEEARPVYGKNPDEILNRAKKTKAIEEEQVDQIHSQDEFANAMML